MTSSKQSLDKKKIRRMMKSLEADMLSSGDLSSGGPIEESIRILGALYANPVFKEAQTVLLYSSLPGEVLTDSLISECLKQGKKVVLPRVNGDVLELKLLESGKIASGYMGIMEPTSDAADVADAEIQLAVIPGVAFSYQAGPDGVERWYRLGRGGGHYDRLLKRLDCPVFALAYPFRMVDELPLNGYDMPVDLVLR